LNQTLINKFKLEILYNQFGKNQMKFREKKLVILIVIGLVFPLIINNTINLGIDQKTGVKNLKLSNSPSFIHIDGSNPNNWTWTAGNYSWCYFDNGYYIIENVTIDASSSPTGSGIYIENSTNVYFIIRNCTIFNADNSFFDSGIWLENTNNGTIIDNNCSNNHQGIYLSNCEANNITENTANNNEYNGIYLETNCDYNNITGNTADNNMFGIQLSINCDYNNITLNTVNENDDYGIYINSAFSSPCDNNVILNNTANENNQYGIYLRYTNNENSIINNSVNNNLETGIYVVNSHIFNVTGNTIYNSKRGLDVSSCDNGNITGNTINSNLEIGIYLYHADSNEIKNNTINRNDLGIRLDNSDYNNITGNTLKDNNWCIYETYGEGNIIENNDCTSPTTELPIYIDDYATGVDAHNWTWAESQPWCSGTGTTLDPYIIENLKISGFGIEKYGIDIRNSNVSFIIQECLIYNSDEAGIYLDNVNNSRLINNNCSNNDNGIYVEYSNNITIFGNTVNTNNFDGIFVYDSNYINITENTANDNNDGISINICDFSYIIGNIGNENSEKGIYLEESDFNSIIGNSVCNNTYCGILITYNSDNNTISGNIINNNTDYGIYLDECENNTISGNLANGNGFVGIHLNSQCRNTVIIGNTVNENTDSGIYFDGSDDHNTISGNILRNNKISGIYFESDDNNNNIISGNILRGGNYGMYIASNSNNNSIFKNFFLENGYHAVDDGTDNKWNSTLIGNYWDNHTEPDVSPQDGIVDTPYNYISGVAGSIDYLPMAEDGAPRIIINSPINGEIFGNEAPTFNVVIIDLYIVEMWYTLDGGLNNYTFIGNGTINQTVWDVLPDGTATIIFYARDIVGNVAFEEVTVIKGTSAGGLDPGVIAVIIALSVIGGVALLGAILVILVKKGKISLEKIKGLSFGRK
jgi:parallel beta-helix repeat protein